MVSSIIKCSNSMTVKYHLDITMDLLKSLDGNGKNLTYALPPRMSSHQLQGL